jgi:hypothetical protein
MIQTDMQKHTKIYLEHFGFDITDFVSCEVCGKQATEIHHIDCKGMGGSKTKDNIENLQAVCRGCHIKFGDKKHWMDYLKDIHTQKMKDHEA